MTIEDVLREMRAGLLPKKAWADAIEAAMREKETWLSPEAYDELMRERQETLHEMARLNSENTLLRTGDTCARHCEGVAFRHEAQRLKADNQRLEDFVSSMKGIANTQGEIIAGQNERIEERDGVIERLLLRELRLNEEVEAASEDRANTYAELAKTHAKIEQLQNLLVDARRVLDWGEPEPKPVLRRIEAALAGKESNHE